jgi:hypothetical protein
MKTPTAINAITPKAAPTPIPAFAPVDRPALSLFCGVPAAGEGVEAIEELDALGAIEALVGDGSKELVIMPRKTGSTLNFSRLGSSQQAFELPQHQNSDVLVPSHGVTNTSFLLCSIYTHMSVFDRALRSSLFHILQSNIDSGSRQPPSPTMYMTL